MMQPENSEEPMNKIEQTHTLQPEKKQSEKQLLQQEKEESCDEKLQAVQRKLEEVIEERDKYLELSKRLAADMENQRKRVERNAELQITLTKERLLLRVIELIDDLEKGIKLITARLSNEKGIIEGLNIILDKAHNLLKSENVQKYESLNHPFDHKLHEAIFTVKVKEKDKDGKIIEVIQEGYKMGEKILRAAKVAVGEYDQN